MIGDTMTDAISSGRSTVGMEWSLIPCFLYLLSFLRKTRSYILFIASKKSLIPFLPYRSISMPLLYLRLFVTFLTVYISVSF